MFYSILVLAQCAGVEVGCVSGKTSRNKGKRGEREVVNLFKQHGIEARRGDSQSRGAREADVELDELGKYWIEVKLGKQPRIRAAIPHAERDSDGRTPIVFWRDDRKDWRVDMGVGAFFELLGEAGLANGIEPATKGES